MNLVGQVLENRYKLLEPIGVGGMGTVYLAEHVLLGEVCAVKVLSPRFAFDPEWVDRFLLEARAAIRIRHDNVVQIKDFACPQPGLVYMVMEAISGESLSDLLRREGAVSWQRALKMADYVASALEAAHACGIIHRDIKPSNCVRTTSRGDDDFIKVLDFGIAKFTAPNDEAAHAPRTATGVWMGTAEYMAPEIFRGEPPDGRVDVYALGVLIYKLITGETPYQGTHLEVAVEQTQRPPMPPSQRAPGRSIPTKVDTLVLRAIARNLGSRTPSMTALREEIEAVLAGPAEDSLVLDVEEYEPTVIRKIPTAPATSSPAHPSTSITPHPPVTNPSETERPPAAIHPATKLAAPTKPIASAVVNSPTTSDPPPVAPPPRSPARSLTRPMSPPRSVVTQTGPRRSVSTRIAPVPATEVSRPRRRVGRVPLVAAALSGIVALSAIAWQVTARTVMDTATPPETAPIEGAGIPSEPTEYSVVTAIDEVLASAATTTSPEPDVTPVAPAPSLTSPAIEEIIVLEGDVPSERPKGKPRPPRKVVKPAPVVEPAPVDQRPLVVTAKDAENTLDRIESDCAVWGIPRGARVTLDITINREGKATHQTIGTSEPLFLDCLKKRLKEAQFPQSQNGGEFRHEFVRR